MYKWFVHTGFQIQLVFPTLVLGRMSKYISDPETFSPERWLKQCDTSNVIHPFASLPYGHGPRMCLGRRFADLEMQILLSKVSVIEYSKMTTLLASSYVFMLSIFIMKFSQLLRNYKLEYHHEPLEYKVTFMYAPDGELKFKMVPRR